MLQIERLTLRLRTKLTGRGALLCAVGLGFLVAGVILWQRDLVRIGVFLVSTPVVALILLHSTPRSVHVQRELWPERVTAGTAATVGLSLHNAGRFTSRLALASESLPYRLGPQPKFVLDSLAGGDGVKVNYRVTPELRGAYRLGPLCYRISDPLGMSELERRDPTVDRIVVRPTVHPLGGAPTGGGVAGGGDIGQRTVAPAGEFDVAVREYRHNDDLRRVHWPSTARQGELMMRSEEQSQERLATVLLDARADAHYGEGTESTLEWSVIAAASVIEHLAAQGYSIRLLTDGIDPGWVAGDDALACDLLQERLALLEAGPDRCLADACEVLANDRVSELVVAVVGRFEVDDARRLASARSGVAFVLGEDGLAPSSAQGLLAQGGWTSVRYTPSANLVALWAELRSRDVSGRLDAGQPGYSRTGWAR